MIIAKHTTLSQQKIQDQMINFQNLLLSQEINVEMFETALCQRKFKSLSDFFEVWACCIAPWFPENIMNITFEELIKFQEVFQFKTDTEKNWKKELLAFCINYSDFRCNDIPSMYNKMKEAIDIAELNNPGLGYTKVNLIPVFGGPMRNKKGKVLQPKKFPTTLEGLNFDAFLHPNDEE
jgi:hypothetical protein